jgi:hypothetical protein
LPQSVPADSEPFKPSAANFRASADGAEDQLSSLYFLACVALRRLLNRVHDLLYAPEDGVALDDGRYPQIVAELDRQLEAWREYLPLAFRFTVDTQEAQTEYGGFLRQRYLTCRAVIYRPYLNHALGQHHARKEVSPYVLEKAEVCLKMGILHMKNLRPFVQTVLIDTWICSLS